MKLDIPYFKHKKDLFKWLIENKDFLYAAKRASIKQADGISCVEMLPLIDVEGVVIKADSETVEQIDKDTLKIRAVINTTNLLDSHGDVHLPGLWKKTLAEGKNFLMLLNNHQMAFEHIIADGKDLKAYTQKISWKELGFTKWAGVTEALIFEAVIRKSRNPFMFEQYSEKRVRNHSVGMRYGKYALAINDEQYGSEYEVWTKYINEIVNKETAEERGFFFAVKEGIAFEGSAVPRGSNIATPTLEVEEKSEPGDHSEVEPLKDTQEKSINYDYLIKNFSL